MHLDGFDGPLDLLLNLVREHQFDIMTVPLASVAEQFLAYIADIESLDVEAAAEYLVVAATLAFLKSRSLLPPLPDELLEEGEDSPEAVEERLRARLIAYSRYRDVATMLRERADEASGFFWRRGGDAGSELSQRFAIAPEKLSRALAKALSGAKPERRTIVRERFSLVMQMEHVLRCIKRDGELTFATLVHGYDKPGIIVTFLAILELVRQGRLAISQEDDSDELHLLPYEVAQPSVN